MSFGHPDSQLVRQFQQRSFQVLKRRITPLSRNQHQVESGRQIVLLQPERLAEQPFQSTPSDGVAMLPRNAQPESRPPLFIPDIGVDQQLSVAGPATRGINPIKIPPMPQAPPGRKTMVVRRNGHWMNP